MRRREQWGTEGELKVSRRSPVAVCRTHGGRPPGGIRHNLHNLVVVLPEPVHSHMVTYCHLQINEHKGDLMHLA